MKITRNIDGQELQRRVQIACLVRNTSMAQLAETLGTSRSTLYHTIHTGTIGFQRLAEIAETLDASIDWLLGDITLDINSIKGIRGIKLSDV